jgi:hypothetical protein
MTLSSPIKIILACFAVAALVKTAMSGRVSASLRVKGSARKRQLGSPKAIKQRSESLLIKTGDGALLKRRGGTAAIARTVNGSAAVNGNTTAIIGQGFILNP